MKKLQIFTLMSIFFLQLHLSAAVNTSMPSIISYLLSSESSTLFTPTYYIDALNGDDSNDGLSAQSAWKSLAKVTSETKNFKAGDIIGFKGGQKFVGRLDIAQLSGSASKPIVYTSYGSGQAMITNEMSVDTWSSEGNNIWSTSITDDVYQVFKGDTSLPNARSEFIHLNDGGGTYLGSADLISHPNLVGSYVHIYPRAWISFTREITSFNSADGSFSVDHALNYGASVGDRFYIVNDKNYMDAQNEWVYTKSESKLYMYSTSKPSNISVVADFTKGVSIYDAHYIELNNLKIARINDKGIKIKKSSHISIKNSTFDHCYTNAIAEGDYGAKESDYSYDIKIINNSISNTVSNGIYFRSATALIEDNTIINNGNLESVTYLNRATTYAMSISGTSIVRNNKIENSAYLGISFYGANILIEKNIIHNFCTELSDGGAIYSYNASHSFDDIGASGSIIRNNFISNDVNRESESSIVGIYLDDRTHDVTITSNHINNVKRGISLHNAIDCTVTNNMVHGVTTSAISIGADPNSGYSPAIVDG